MSFASLFDDFPVMAWDNGRQRRSRPLLYSLLDTLEDEMEQKVGYVFNRLPALMRRDDDFEPHGKKRKLRSDMSLSSIEPRSKIQVTTKDDKFQVQMDASHFSPEKITVKVIGDKIAISAKHENKGSDVYEFHEVYRAVDLPEGVDPETVTSRLSSAGQLTIEAPMKQKEPVSERTVHVQVENKENEKPKENEQPKEKEQPKENEKPKENEQPKEKEPEEKKQPKEKEQADVTEEAKKTTNEEQVTESKK